MYVCIICVPGTHKSQKKVSDLLELETADCKLPVRCWESNPGPVEEEPVLFTAVPSLQPEGGGGKNFICDIHSLCLFNQY